MALLETSEKVGKAVWKVGKDAGGDFTGENGERADPDGVIGVGERRAGRAEPVARLGQPE